MRVRIPRGQLTTISADLQRTATAMNEVERRLSRTLGGLQDLPRARRHKRQDEAEEQLMQAYSQARQLADQAMTLARSLTEAVSIMDAADQRAAARIPSMPRLIGVLPVLRPESHPWPYAPVPAVTMIRPARAPVTPISTETTGNGRTTSDGG
jgi:hypothetical protein